MNKERLLKLADHLEHGELGVDHFNFSYYHIKNSCGTSGCAIGECPTIWPDDWEHKFNTPHLIGSSIYTADYDGVKWFELAGIREYIFLFLPNLWENDYISDIKNRLPPEATKERVALRIRRFVESGGKMLDEF